MIDKKSLGQYYTPINISDIMRLWINPEAHDVVLDPAIGSGNLIQRINANIVGFDIDPICLEECRSRNPYCDIHEQDYLESQGMEYVHIISNPPYLKYNKFKK